MNWKLLSCRDVTELLLDSFVSCSEAPLVGNPSPIFNFTHCVYESLESVVSWVCACVGCVHSQSSVIICEDSVVADCLICVANFGLHEIFFSESLSLCVMFFSAISDTFVVTPKVTSGAYSNSHKYLYWWCSQDCFCHKCFYCWCSKDCFWFVSTAWSTIFMKQFTGYVYSKDSNFQNSYSCSELMTRQSGFCPHYLV